ncbi:hypothetical protein GCM10010306_015580 [Streptomyces umbrinus]|nr:hypothetical protein GCM10010306_015580 [Streptomyces umbrinus]
MKALDFPPYLGTLGILANLYGEVPKDLECVLHKALVDPLWIRCTEPAGLAVATPEVLVGPPHVLFVICTVMFVLQSTHARTPRN